LEKAQADYAALLESTNCTIATRDKKITELRSQLDRETADREEVETQLTDRDKQIAELRSQLEQERADREELQKDFDELNEKYLSEAFVAEALENKKSATASKDLPEAADLLNQLKSKRKKSTTTLADLEAILEILES
jgi:chromosome segregation ATPase